MIIGICPTCHETVCCISGNEIYYCTSCTISCTPACVLLPTKHVSSTKCVTNLDSAGGGSNGEEAVFFA